LPVTPTTTKDEIPQTDLENLLSKYGKELHIHNMEDWYYVSAPHLKMLSGGANLLRKYLKQKGEGEKEMGGRK
jgi:hypothetical protein